MVVVSSVCDARLNPVLCYESREVRKDKIFLLMNKKDGVHESHGKEFKVSGLRLFTYGALSSG